jgi:hypothetical protein
MNNQQGLWKRVIAAKRWVLDAIVGKPDAVFRETQVWQAYTGLCAEAEFAHDDNQLDEETTRMLEEYAEKVIKAWKEHMEAK